MKVIAEIWVSSILLLGLYVVSPSVLLQNLKMQLKQITRIFTNPYHHLLSTILPLLPTARSDRASYQAVDKVSLVCDA